MADGNDYNLIQLKEQGQPVEIIYPTEGNSPDHGPERAVQGGAESQRGAPFPELAETPVNPSSCWSTLRAPIPCTRWSSKSPAAKRSRKSKRSRTIRLASKRALTRSRRGTRRYLECETSLQMEPGDECVHK